MLCLLFLSLTKVSLREPGVAPTSRRLQNVWVWSISPSSVSSKPIKRQTWRETRSVVLLLCLIWACGGTSCQLELVSPLFRSSALHLTAEQKHLSMNYYQFMRSKWILMLKAKHGLENLANFKVSGWSLAGHLLHSWVCFILAEQDPPPSLHITVTRFKRGH